MTEHKQPEGRVYVLQLNDGSLYVGSTFKSVDERIADNFTLADGTVLDPDAARNMPPDTKWKYGSPGVKLIRNKFEVVRDDLLRIGAYHERVAETRNEVEQWETRMSRLLTDAGYTVHGDKA